MRLETFEEQPDAQPLAAHVLLDDFLGNEELFARTIVQVEIEELSRVSVQVKPFRSRTRRQFARAANSCPKYFTTPAVV
jgi:hypothetical protein